MTYPFFQQGCTVHIRRLIEPSRDPMIYLDGVHLFEKACRKVFWKNLFHRLIHRPLRRLEDLNEVKKQITFQGSHYLGVCEVPIRQIRGSIGRDGDFDADFLPLTGRLKERWVSIASAMFQGVGLPAVELVKVGEIYFVQDGNHRVSVARAMGRCAIDAVVVEWQTAGRLPWEPARVRGCVETARTGSA